MKTNRPITKTIAIILSIMMVADYGFAAQIGKITYTEGRVDIFRTGSDAAIIAKEGDLVFEGDSVRTKSNSKAEISFADKSISRLAQNTKLDIEEYKVRENGTRQSASILIERGKARTTIAKMADRAVFNINTPNAKGSVKGSEVIAYYQAGNSGMLVTEGLLSLTSSAHPEKEINVPAGTSVTIPQEDMPKEPRPYLEIEKKLHEMDTTVPERPVKRDGDTIIRGVVTRISGEVKITKKGETSARALGMNEILEPGDRINTGKNGSIEIRLDNGNVLNLKSDSDLFLENLTMDPATGEYDNTFRSEYGKIKARIEGLKGNSSFKIKTPTAISGARGTIMYLDIGRTATKSFFEGGMGYMKSMISGMEKAIDAGQNAKADGAGGLSDPAPTSDEDRMEWSSGWEAGSGVEGYSSPDSGAGIELTLTDDGGGIIGGLDTDAGKDIVIVVIPPEPPKDPDEGEDETDDIIDIRSLATGTIYNKMTNNGGYLGNLKGTFELARETRQSGIRDIFMSVGDFTNDSENNDFSKFVWTSGGRPVVSTDPETESYTTLDGGAFYGITGGIGAGIDGLGAMGGFARFLYIDPDGKAGIFGGDLLGYFFEEPGLHALAGEMSGFDLINGIDTGIAPSMLYKSVYRSKVGDGYLEGNGLAKDGSSYSIYGHDNFWTYAIADYDKGPVQRWGIYQQDFYNGGFMGNVPGDWTAMMGGMSDAFGGIRAYIYTYGSYDNLDQAGTYKYHWYSNSTRGYLGYSEYSISADGSGYESRYYKDGTFTTVDKLTGAVTHGTWDTSRPISEIVSVPPEGNYELSDSGSYRDADDDRGYWIADITGASWDDGAFSAELSGKFLTRTKMGRLEGDILGIFGLYDDQGEIPSGWLRATGMGEWEGDALTLSGAWGDDDRGVYSIFDNDEGSFDRVTEDEGYLGSLTASWWAERVFPYLAMGEADLGEREIDNTQFLWNSPILSGNGIDDDELTPDGGFFTGYSTGIINEDAMKGDSVAIYISPDGYAGLMSGGVYGRMYSAIDMWSMDGVFMPERMAAFNIEDGFPSENINYMSNLRAHVIYESEDEYSYVEGWHDQGQTQFIDGQTWGIYNLRLGVKNDYKRPAEARAWSGKILGTGTFGRGTTPNLGIMSGNVYGLYEDEGFKSDGEDYVDGYWIASSVGSWKSRAILFDEENEGTSDNGAYFGYIGTLLTDDGLMIGKMAALYAGSMESLESAESMYDKDIEESYLGLILGEGSFFDEGPMTVDAKSFEGSAAGFDDMDWGIWAAKFTGDESDSSGLFALSLTGGSDEDHDMFGEGADPEGMWTALVSGVRIPGSEILKGSVRGIMISGEEDSYYSSLLTGDMLGLYYGGGQFDAITLGEWRFMSEIDADLVGDDGLMEGFISMFEDGSFSGSGYGSFDNGSPIEILTLDGFTLNIRGTQQTDWGIWTAFISGTCSEPGSVFNIAFGATTDDDYTMSYDRYLIGTIRGYREGDELTAFINALAMGKNDDDDTKMSAYAMTGNANGYIEVDEAGVTTWQASGAGEWVEVTDLFDPSQLGFDAAGLQDFVSVPITEVYSAANLIGTGGFDAGGSIRGAIDINFYASSSDVLSQVWTALISGTYSGPTGSTWNLSVANPGGDSAQLTGTQWSDGQWLANVQGSTATGLTFNGQAGGAYTDPNLDGTGTFTGVGAGTFEQSGSDPE